MPCSECGASPAEQTPKPLSDEELRRVTKCVLDILRAEESSRKAADRPTVVEQVPDSDDGRDGAMGETTTAEPTHAESLVPADGRTLRETVDHVYAQIKKASRILAGLRNRDYVPEGAVFVDNSPLVPYILDDE